MVLEVGAEHQSERDRPDRAGVPELGEAAGERARPLLGELAVSVAERLAVLPALGVARLAALPVRESLAVRDAMRARDHRPGFASYRAATARELVPHAPEPAEELRVALPDEAAGAVGGHAVPYRRRVSGPPRLLAWPDAARRVECATATGRSPPTPRTLVGAHPGSRYLAPLRTSRGPPDPGGRAGRVLAGGDYRVKPLR